jgi:two-component system alkaline phosphatase synthesis response regulator PhoP
VIFTSPRRRILVVDDEPHIVELLVMHLRQSGFDSLVAGDGENAFEIAASNRPDLILLDLMLPGIGGLETCRRLRQDSRTAAIPIIMLTAKSEESDKVIGLGIGADDYVTKPFGLRELIARIEVALRHAIPAARSVDPSPICAGELLIDVGGHTVMRMATRVEITPAEFALLVYLARDMGKVVSRESLECALRSAGATAEGRSLDVHVRNIRRKLDPSPLGKSYLSTVRGVGYRLDA